nr:putative integron gene cassette protein [uncultured bacterium]
MSNRLILLLITSAFTSGCATQGPDVKKPGVPIWSRPSAASEAGCREIGGHWFHSRSGEDFCDVPATDAGRVCRDSSECESRCVASNDIEPNTKVVGHCDQWHFSVGRCVNRVVRGRATGGMCVD